MNEPLISESWIIPRSGAVLQRLPLRFRWEFTRRHPYYLMHWKQAIQQHEFATSEDRFEFEAAQMMLQLIGVIYEPIDPALNFEDLGLSSGPNDSPWREGAVSQIPVRGLVTILARQLPRETKLAVIELLQKSLRVDFDDFQQEHGLIMEILKGGHPGFDGVFGEQFLMINPEAPLRAINKAVGQIVRQYKQAHGLIEHRQQIDKFQSYLDVWDLREGWTGNGYANRNEQRFKEIARTLKKPLQTIANQYRSAFELLSGKEYSAENWFRVCGAFKLGGLLGDEIPRVSLARPIRRREWNPISETRLSSGRENRVSLIAHVTVRDTREIFEMLMDLRDLVSRGWDNDKILRELELSPESDALHLLQQVRQGDRILDLA